MMDTRIFKASKICKHSDGWVADVGEKANPDHLFNFYTHLQAKKFLELLDAGMRISIAAHLAITSSSRTLP
jgi:hypothetical protein